MKKTPVTPSLLREWSTLIQLQVLDALPRVMPLTARQFAFHGGTSLNLSWRSPRFSEDLDFLMANREVSLPNVMRKLGDRIKASLLLSHPDLMIEISDKSRSDRLAHFQVAVSSRRYHGTAMVKLEFWKVEPSYMEKYQSVFVTPVREGDYISRTGTPLPAATLESAFADKITAFATRPYLKWRDIFDFWWIDRQSPQDVEMAAARFLHHVSAYNTIDNLLPAHALRAFLDRETPDGMFAKADPDLKKWLPAPLWSLLNPDGVKEMITFTRGMLEQIADATEYLQQRPTD